jgi:hypothetical protein
MTGTNEHHGITIHTNQGLTLEKAVVELGRNDFSAGPLEGSQLFGFQHYRLSLPDK